MARCNPSSFHTIGMLDLGDVFIRAIEETYRCKVVVCGVHIDNIIKAEINELITSGSGLLAT